MAIYLVEITPPEILSLSRADQPTQARIQTKIEAELAPHRAQLLPPSDTIYDITPPTEQNRTRL